MRVCDVATRSLCQKLHESVMTLGFENKIYLNRTKACLIGLALTHCPSPHKGHRFDIFKKSQRNKSSECRYSNRLFWNSMILPFVGKFCWNTRKRPENSKQLTSSAVTLCKVSALDHEVLNDTMELASLVAFANRFLSQLDEVFCGLWHSLPEDSNDDIADILITNFHDKRHLWISNLR